jgi:hypothetical protein
MQIALWSALAALCIKMVSAQHSMWKSAPDAVSASWLVLSEWSGRTRLLISAICAKEEMRPLALQPVLPMLYPMILSWRLAGLGHAPLGLLPKEVEDDQS